MKNKPPVVYWDACSFIYRVQRDPSRIDDLESLTDLAEKGKLLIVTSTLTLSEVLCLPKHLEDRENVLSQFKSYFDHEWIEVRPVDRKTSEIAAEIRSEYNLKIPDSIHIASCLRFGIKYLHTYDHDHLLKKDKTIGSPPLRIILPRYPEDFPLFDESQDDPTVLKFARPDDETDLDGRETASSD